MNDVLFRSCQKVSQSDFTAFVETLPPTDVHRYELLDGFIVREPPARWPHGEIEAELARRLANVVRAAKAGRTFGSSQGFDLPSGDTVEPDVCFVSAARWEAAPRVAGYPRVVPDLVFEILSPSTAKLDRREKKRVYERNGVQEYVLVDPAAKTFECFRLQGARFAAGRVLGVAKVFASSVLPGLDIAVGEVFGDL